jgi:hypothetical protein
VVLPIIAAATKVMAKGIPLHSSAIFLAYSSISIENRVVFESYSSEQHPRFIFREGLYSSDSSASDSLLHRWNRIFVGKSGEEQLQILKSLFEGLERGN